MGGKGPPLVEVAHVLGELLLPGLRVAAGLGALDEDRADLRSRIRARFFGNPDAALGTSRSALARSMRRASDAPWSTVILRHADARTCCTSMTLTFHASSMTDFIMSAFLPSAALTAREMGVSLRGAPAARFPGNTKRRGVARGLGWLFGRHTM